MLFLVLVADILVLVFVNGIVIFPFLVIFVFVNENHTTAGVTGTKGHPNIDLWIA